MYVKVDLDAETYNALVRSASRSSRSVKMQAEALIRTSLGLSFPRSDSENGSESEEAPATRQPAAAK